MQGNLVQEKVSYVIHYVLLLPLIMNKEKRGKLGGGTVVGDLSKNNNNNIIFIDTENTFRPERIHQIAEGRGLEPEEIMKRVFVCKIYNSAHLEVIIKILASL